MTKINTAKITQAEIKEIETKELLELYNEITGENIARFADRKSAECRTWAAIGRLAPEENIAEKKRKRIMRFCFAPGNSKDFQEPKEGTLRAKLFSLLNRNNGVLFSEIQATFKWHSRNTYEAIRLVHRNTNYGMWSTLENGDIRIRLIKNQSEYANLIKDSKAA